MTKDNFFCVINALASVFVADLTGSSVGTFTYWLVAILFTISSYSIYSFCED